MRERVVGRDENDEGEKWGESERRKRRKQIEKREG